MKDYRLFGQAVRSRRKALGMTLEDVALSANVGLATVSALERAVRLPRVDTADMIASALLTTLDHLIGETETE